MCFRFPACRHTRRWWSAPALALLMDIAAAQPSPVAQTPAVPRLMVQSGRLTTGIASANAEKLALSPGAQLMASANRESIRIWHTATGRLLCELQLDRVNQARRNAAATLAQLRELQQARDENRSPRNVGAAEPKEEASAANPAAYAWSADARTLYGAWPGLPMQVWDIERCRHLGALPLPLGGVTATSAPDALDSAPSELQSLADGRLLANSPAGLYRAAPGRRQADGRNAGRQREAASGFRCG